VHRPGIAHTASAGEFTPSLWGITFQKSGSAVWYPPEHGCQTFFSSVVPTCPGHCLCRSLLL